MIIPKLKFKDEVEFVFDNKVHTGSVMKFYPKDRMFIYFVLTHGEDIGYLVWEHDIIKILKRWTN